MRVESWINFPPYIHLLMLANVLIRIAILSIVPFFPLAFSHDPWVANLLVSGFLSGDLIGGMLVGYLADKYKESSFSILFSLGLVAIGSVFLLFPQQSSGLISIFSFLMGCGIYGVSIIITSYIAQGTKDELKKTAFQYQFWAGNVASMFGVGLGWLALDMHKNEFLFIYNCLSIVLASLILLFVKKKEPFSGFKVSCEKINLHSLFKLLSPYILTMLVVRLTLSICHQQLRTTLPIFLNQHSIDSNKLYSYSLIVSILISIALQRPIDRITETRSWVRIFLLFCLPAGMLLLSLQGMIPLLIATAFYTLGEMVVFPLTQYLSEKRFPSESKTTSFGFLNLARIGFVIGGPIGVIVGDYSSYSAVFLFSAVLLLMAVAAVEVFLKKDRTQEEQTVSTKISPL
jgi:MFS family permease